MPQWHFKTEKRKGGPIDDDILALAISQILPVFPCRTEDRNLVCSVREEEVQKLPSTSTDLEDKMTSDANEPLSF